MFKNVARYDNDGISNLLELNLRYWLEDSFMRIGAIIPEQQSILSPSESNNIQDLQIWNAGTQNWAYKIADGKRGTTLVPATVTVNGHIDNEVSIDYNRGQVTFAEHRIPAENDTVIATHYTNRVSILTSLELNRRPMIQLGEGRAIGEDVSVFQELAVSEVVKPPFIIIETFPTGSAQPYALGTGAVWSNSRVQLNVVTETVGELSKILDILRVQSFNTIENFDTNRATLDGVLPIDPITGDINPEGLQYPELLAQYYLNTMKWRSISVRKFKTNKEDIHVGIAYFTVEIVSNPRA